MDQTFKNIETARDYWDAQAAVAKVTLGYVVAQPTGLRVVADNTAVMLAGCCRPFIFGSRTAAGKVAAEDGPIDFDGEPRLEVMTYEAFCHLQAVRFADALHAARVASAMARQHAVAA